MTYNAISSHTEHFEIQKRDSEESLLTFLNLFPSKGLTLKQEGGSVWIVIYQFYSIYIGISE